MKKGERKLEAISKEEMIAFLEQGKPLVDIGNDYGVCVDTVYLYLKFLGINFKDYFDYRAKYDIHIFDSINTSDKAYWLGFLYADGCVRSGDINNSISLHLSSVDEDHIVKFKAFMKDTRDDSFIKHQTRTAASGRIQYMTTYSICNKHLKESLTNLGCTPQKSLTLKFPDLSIFSDGNLVIDFIRGYIDGDGCLYADKVTGDLKAVSLRGTPEFLEGVMKIFPQFRIYSEVDKRTGRTQYKLSTWGKKAVEVVKTLYKNRETSTYLTRKFNKIAYLFSDDQMKSGKDGEV